MTILSKCGEENYNKIIIIFPLLFITYLKFMTVLFPLTMFSLCPIFMLRNVTLYVYTCKLPALLPGTDSIFWHAKTLFPGREVTYTYVRPFAPLVNFHAHYTRGEYY